MSVTVSVSSWLGQWAVSVAVIATLLSVTTVLTIAVTVWQDMMHNDTIQKTYRHGFSADRERSKHSGQPC